MTRHLLLAALRAAVGVIKGQRPFWQAYDEVSAWFVGLADVLDPGEDDKPDRGSAFVPQRVSDR